MSPDVDRAPEAEESLYSINPREGSLISLPVRAPTFGLKFRVGHIDLQRIWSLKYDWQFCSCQTQ